MTPVVDGLWTWGAKPLGGALPQAELRPLDEASDARAVGLVGEHEGFVGVIAAWSSHERLADEFYEMKGAARDWFIFYSTATQFHANASRHFFVTADTRLLSELRGGRRQRYWQKRRVVSIAGALRLAGQVMNSRERIYEEARENYLRHVSVYTLYFYLSAELAPSRIRLHRWLEGRPREHARELAALEQSMHDRVVDLLKARDRIALQNARDQDNATRDEILYHLRAAIGSAAALFDSLAVFAQLALRIDEEGVGGAVGISVRNPKLRRLLRKAGAAHLAEAAGDLAPMLELTWSLRTPIAHRAGLSGSGYLNLGGSGARESRVRLSEDQARALDGLRRHRHESTQQWGKDGGPSHDVVVEPQVFSNRFCLAAIDVAERLTRALAQDLDAPEHTFERDDREQRAIRRYRWLAGLPSENFFST